ncbi:MAG: class I SAM-dependent methyltransferase [bacterium]|nr:class I SAM-dependent methyltransferase [bacterium]
MSDLNSSYEAIRKRGERFAERRVAESYVLRPPYSEEAIERLLALLAEHPRVLLDAGCGTGKLARSLVSRVDRVDAVDPSPEMIRIGRSEPGGGHPSLRWIESGVEGAVLEGPYGLAVAGASFHWFDADIVLPRLASALAPGAFLALLSGDAPWEAAWRDAELELYFEFASRMRGEPVRWTPVDLEETPLLQHPGFATAGYCLTEPTKLRQRVEDYVACQHSRASFTHEAMGETLALEFDRELEQLLDRHARDGWLQFEQRTRIEWGRPLS